MADDYAKYERECETIRQENVKLLDEFAEGLAAKGLTAGTVRKHRQNVDFYVNEFLLYEEATRPQDGVSSVGMFLGYWFIRKAMWASKESIKSNAASLKKFYAFMLQKGKVTQDDLDDLKMEIKEGLPEWLATLTRYDDPDIDDPDEIW